MRRKILIIGIMLFWAVAGWGQDAIIQIKQGNNYYLNPTKMFDKGDFFKKTTGNKANVTLFKGQNYILRVRNVVENTVYFTFWKFEDSVKQKEINGKEKDIIYEMPLSEFIKTVSIYYNRIDWQVGAYNVPYKLRFNEFDFTSNINVGLNLSAKIRYNRREENGFALAPMIGIGVTGIDINTANSRSTVVAKPIAYTVNTGGLIFIKENINIGVLLGWDILSAADQENYGWKHNGKPWLGLGINFSFSVADKNGGNGKGN